MRLTVGGAALASVGVFLLSRLSVHGEYVTGILPGMIVMGVGFGASATA